MRRLDGSTLLSLSKLYLVLRALNICPLAQNQLHEPWFSGYNLKYLIYGCFGNFDISYQGTMDTTYKYIIYVFIFPISTLVTRLPQVQPINTWCHFTNFNITYQGTPGTTYKYLIYVYFTNFNISYQGTLGKSINTWYMVFSQNQHQLPGYPRYNQGYNLI